MGRARIEALVLLVAVAHIFVAGRAALSKPDRAEAERLFVAARAAEDAGEFGDAAVGFFEIYREHPYAPQAAEAGFRLARVLLWGYQKFDSAEEVLENVAEGYPGTTHGDGAAKMLAFVRRHRADNEEALTLFFKHSNALRGKKKDAEEAKRILQEVLSKYPGASIAGEARVALARLEQGRE